jgi:hypothetical protein
VGLVYTTDGWATFSNFEIRETPPVAWGHHEPAMPPATITKWSLSPSLDALERDLERPLSKSDPGISFDLSPVCRELFLLEHGTAVFVGGNDAHQLADIR